MLIPPAKIRDAVQAYIQDWSRQETHGLIRRLIRPYPLYRYVAPAEGGGSHPVTFETIGWRVFLRSKTGQMAAVDAIVRSDGKYGFRLYTSEVATRWLSRARSLQRRKRVSKEYTARILLIPAIHVSMLWFRSSLRATRDLFARLDRFENQDRKDDPWIARQDLDEIIRSSMASASEMWKKAQARAGPMET